MRYRVPPHVHFRPIHEEVMLLDDRTDAYLGLNAAAGAVWLTLAEGGNEEQAAEELLARYDVGRATATADVSRLIEQLVVLGLLEPGDA